MININYNLLGKVEYIYIKIDDYFALAPYNSNSRVMDWDSIQYEATRNSIKQAWDNWAAGKDLEYELRDRPELAIPTPKPEPNWQGFNVELLQSVAYNRIAKQSTNLVHLQALQIMLGTYGYNPNVKPDLPLIASIWQVVVWGLETPPTPIEIESINDLCDRYSIGFNLSDSGFMEVL